MGPHFGTSLRVHWSRALFVGRGESQRRKQAAQGESPGRLVSIVLPVSLALARPAAARAARAARAGGAGRAQRGSVLLPIKLASTSRAACRPSRIAQTTRLWPRRMSPAANTLATLVR